MPTVADMGGTKTLPGELDAILGAELRGCNELIPCSRLAELGISRRGLENLVSTGRLIRVTRGLFVPAGTDAEVIRAAQLRGRLTGTSLLAKLNVWRPIADRSLHIAIPSGTHWPSTFPNHVVRHTSHIPGRLLLREPLVSALGHVLTSFPRDECVAVCDSLVRQRVMSRTSLSSALTTVGTAKARSVRELLDPSAESGVESLMRLWLVSRGITFRPQVQIGPFRVDFLVGSRLVIEVIGEQFHGGAREFEADAERESYLQGRGFQVLRVTARQVMSHERQFAADVVAMLRRGEHVGRRQRAPRL